MAIQEKARRERIGSASFWSPDELETLALHYPLHGPDWRGWASRLPGRTKSAIAQRAYADGLTSRKKRFTRSEDALLLRMRASGASISRCARRLGVTPYQAKYWLQKLESIYREGVA